MFNRTFLTSAAERAVRAFAWAVLSLWAVGDGLLNAFSVDWGEALGVGLGAAVLSLLGSVAASAVGDHASPSFVDEPGKHAAPEN